MGLLSPPLPESGTDGSAIDGCRRGPVLSHSWSTSSSRPTDRPGGTVPSRRGSTRAVAAPRANGCASPCRSRRQERSPTGVRQPEPAESMPEPELTSPLPRHFLDRMREARRVRHRSPRTEEACVGRILRFNCHYRGWHPRELRPDDVTAFLSSLATDRNVAASAQYEELSVLLTLNRDVRGNDLPWLDDFLRAPRPARLPVSTRTSSVAGRSACGVRRTCPGRIWRRRMACNERAERILEDVRIRVLVDGRRVGVRGVGASGGTADPDRRNCPIPVRRRMHPRGRAHE